MATNLVAKTTQIHLLTLLGFRTLKWVSLVKTEVSAALFRGFRKKFVFLSFPTLQAVPTPSFKTPSSVSKASDGQLEPWPVSITLTLLPLSSACKDPCDYTVLI